MPLRQRRWNQTAGAAGGRQPGLVGGELLEREPFAAGGFEAGDVLLGSAAGGCRGLLLGGGCWFGRSGGPRQRYCRREQAPPGLGVP